VPGAAQNPECTRTAGLSGTGLASTERAEATMVSASPVDEPQGVPMADPETPASSQGPVIISNSSSERAPIIYFDGASCFGHHNGAIQIELAANLLMPVGAAVRVDVVQTAHLRCSPAAALALREALDKALAMLKLGQQQPEEAIPAMKN
jgi:hypothetical protein